MDISVEVVALGVVIFFSGYYVGWFTKSRWEAKLKPMFIKEGKEMKRKRAKSKKPHWIKSCANCVDEFKTDPTERW